MNSEYVRSLETLPRRARFLCSLISKRAGNPGRECRFCASSNTVVIGRKYSVMQVRRCKDCGLMFRWPCESEQTNNRFYQSRYSEEEVTDLPPAGEIPGLLARNFSGTLQDRSSKIALLKDLMPPPARVLDFGCSWGYGLHQLTRAGYDAIGFEISQPRAAFGRSMIGARIISKYDELDALPASSFDAIYSYHVLEHLPALTGVFERFARLLRTGGAMLLFTPNCGDGTGKLRDGWKVLVGEVHTMAFDTLFFRRALPDYGFETLAFTAPVSIHEIRNGVSNHHDDGYELLIYGKRTWRGKTS
jgi:2-polyprenyl-3-methyl-5-hydroxy-6-metoxy-1,4-benzoquinol methylase